MWRPSHRVKGEMWRLEGAAGSASQVQIPSCPVTSGAGEPREELEQSRKPSSPLVALPSQYIIECAIISKLPPVSFNLGGVWFNLTAQDYVIQVE